MRKKTKNSANFRRNDMNEEGALGSWVLICLYEWEGEEKWLSGCFGLVHVRKKRGGFFFLYQFERRGKEEMN